MSQVFGLFALVCRWWKTSGWRLRPSLLLSSSPSLHLTAPWGVSMAAPLLSTPFGCVCARMCVCVWRALLLLPPPPSASYLHLLQSWGNTHLCSLSLSLSLSLSFFPTTHLFLPTTIFPFFLFFFADKGVSAHLHPWSLAGGGGERWGSH